MVGAGRLFDDDQTGKINFANLKRVINMVGLKERERVGEGERERVRVSESE